MQNDVTSSDKVLIDLYGSGYSIRQVGAILGLDRKTVRRRLEAHLIHLRPANNVTRSKWLASLMESIYS